MQKHRSKVMTELMFPIHDKTETLSYVLWQLTPSDAIMEEADIDLSKYKIFCGQSHLTEGLSMDPSEKKAKVTKRQTHFRSLPLYFCSLGV